LLASEREALAIIACGGAWRPPAHPRLKDRSPSLEWSAVRNIHDPAVAPWTEVRPLLVVVEAAARRARAEEEAPE
jgi:hypothetical protein